MHQITEKIWKTHILLQIEDSKLSWQDISQKRLASANNTTYFECSDAPQRSTEWSHDQVVCPWRPPTDETPTLVVASHSSEI